MLCMKLSWEREELLHGCEGRGDSGSSGMVEFDIQWPKTSLLWLKLPPMFRLEERERVSIDEKESLRRPRVEQLPPYALSTFDSFML